MPLFRRSVLNELDRHQWKSEPGILRIDFVDESQLADLALQLGVPAPDRLTRSHESTASAKMRGKLGELGAAQGERVEAVYEQQKSTARILRRVIDRLWSTRSILDADDLLAGSGPSLGEEGLTGPAAAAEVLQLHAVAQRLFVLAERTWMVRLLPPELSGWSTSYFSPNLGSVDVPLKTFVGPQPTTDDLGRLRWGQQVHAAVFGHAAEWRKKQGKRESSLSVNPIAIFERRGGAEDFSWSSRKQ